MAPKTGNIVPECRHACPNFGTLPGCTSEELLDLGLEGGCQIFPVESVGDVCHEEADLGAGVVDRPVEPDGMERLPCVLMQAEHGVRELDFAPGSALLVLEQVEDRGVENIAPRDV